MEQSNIESEKSAIPNKQTHKQRDHKRKFTFTEKNSDKKDEELPKFSRNPTPKEVLLTFDYGSLSFKTTKPLSAFELTSNEKDLISDMLTDIEQENNLRLYKYLHNILLLVLLFIGCALYFTIVVPVLCLLFIIYLLCKKKNFRNSIFDKIKQSMLEIEDEYNELLDRYFVVIYISNGESGEKENEKKRKIRKRIKKNLKGIKRRSLKMKIVKIRIRRKRRN